MLSLYVFKFIIFLMETEKVLNNLQKRNNSLKFQLRHNQLKHGTYPFNYSRKYILAVLNQYKIHKSFFKVSSIVGISQLEILNWYVQGIMENPKFRGFSLAINEINKNEMKFSCEEVVSDEIRLDDEGDYMISEYGDGWSYKTYIDGEKIFIISDDLETLKKKVKDKRLPLD